MTAARALIRRGLWKSPICIPIPKKSQLAWLALRAVKDDWQDWKEISVDKNPSALLHNCKWGIPVGFLPPRLEDDTLVLDLAMEAKSYELKRIVREVIEFMGFRPSFPDQGFMLGFNYFQNPIHQCAEVKAISDLQSAAPNAPSKDCYEVASRLALAMIGILNLVRERHPIPFYDWVIEVQQGPGVKAPWIIRGLRDNPVDQALLSAELRWGISLWLHSLTCMSKGLDTLSDHPEMYDLLTFKPWSWDSYIRIVGGGNPSKAQAMASELSTWLERPTYTVPKYDWNWRLRDSSSFSRYRYKEDILFAQPVFWPLLFSILPVSQSSMKKNMARS